MPANVLFNMLDCKDSNSVHQGAEAEEDLECVKEKEEKSKST
jgi:hypothetical protein